MEWRSRALLRFNPRSRRGSDLTSDVTGPPDLFQSTLPQGERLSAWYVRRNLRGFNPRSRRGSEPRWPSASAESGFNPRSRRGSDVPSWDDIGSATNVSIHAPAGGATRHSHSQSLLMSVRCFNPRSRRGSDLMAGKFPMHMGFNPRSRRGSDPRPHNNAISCFNPRSRRGSDSGL